MLVASLQRQLDERRRDPGDLPVNGCGDNSCEVRTSRGMATNGGCSCDKRELRWAMKYWKRVAAFREETIREMVQREAEIQREIARLMQREEEA